MTEALHKPISPRKAEDKTISKVYLAHEQWTPVKSGTKVPSSKKLFNFDLKAGDQTLLVLDNYGNELLPDKIERRILNVKKFDYTLAINRRTGVVFLVSFGIEKGRYIAIISPFDLGVEHPMFRVPENFRIQLENLESKKRPYTISLDSPQLLSFIEREEGFNGLRHGIIVSFDFGTIRVELGAHGDYRVVTQWKDVNSESPGTLPRP